MQVSCSVEYTETGVITLDQSLIDNFLQMSKIEHAVTYVYITTIRQDKKLLHKYSRSALHVLNFVFAQINGVIEKTGVHSQCVVSST